MKYSMLIITLLMVLGCSTSEKIAENTKTHYMVIEIQGCEYIQSSYRAGYDGYGYLAHKGNCKYCAERNK